MEKKQVKIQPMEVLTREEHESIVKALEKLSGFKFYVHSQTLVE